MARKIATNRKCIVCRNDFLKKDLFRFVQNLENEVLFDVFFKAPGKGSYVCKNTDCIKKALNKGIIGKVLKAKQPENLKEQIINALNTKIKGAISLLNKAGMLVFGTQRVLDAIKLHKLDVIIYATDSSESTKEKLTNSCNLHSVQTIEFLDKTALEQLTQTANTTVLGLRESELTNALEKNINDYKVLSNT
ncbi:MAG: DUF448 domain-containing protein [Proteobacteria bacterium]|nr:DUF448 domain-containing protein [Pseudomonadota bacterium]